MNSLAGNHVVLWGPPQEDLNALREILARRGLIVQQADSLDDLRAAVLGEEVDLVMARLCRCLERPLLDLLVWLQNVPSPPQVLIVADAMNVELYLEAMRRGAFDCVGLPLNENELMRIVTSAAEARLLHSAVARGGK